MGDMLELVVKVHGYQLLIAGFVNIDPHSGNILVMSDGRIGLIDFGQCVEFSTRDRRVIAQLLLALDSKDRGAIVNRMQVDGYQVTNSDPTYLYGAVHFWFDGSVIKYEEDQNESLDLRSIQQK